MKEIRFSLTQQALYYRDVKVADMPVTDELGIECILADIDDFMVAHQGHEFAFKNVFIDEDAFIEVHTINVSGHLTNSIMIDCAEHDIWTEVLLDVLGNELQPDDKPNNN